MRLFASLFAFVLLLSALPLRAEVVPALYQVREPVVSQQPADRLQALQRALDTLVLRMTGDVNAAQSAALVELRKDPQQLVSQYRYEGSQLVVDFDPLSTERSLRQAGLSLWGANRPLLLVWWLNQEPAGSSLVGDGQDMAAPIQAAAQNRGLPVRLPLADLNEQLVATADNLLAAKADLLLPAAERYAADAQLGVVAQPVDGKWQAQWNLWLAAEHEQGSVEAADPAALADAVLLAVSVRLAPRFVAAAGAVQQLTLVVEGANLQRYAELERLLEPFAGKLLQVQGGRLTYQVQASPEQLRAQLALARLQEVLPAADGQTPSLNSAVAPVDQRQLTFRW